MKHIAIALAVAASSIECVANDNIMKTLDTRQQSIVTVAAFEARGDMDGLAGAIGNALDNGIDVSSLKEVFAQLYAYTGFPRSLNALGTLQSVIARRTERGIQDAPGRDASPLPADYDALSQGTQVQTRLCGGTPFTYAFDASEDYYLKAHLFGDIFARDILTFAEREMATIGALSALEGCAPQLKAHVSGARNMGVTDDQLHAIPAVPAAKVGAMESWRTAQAVADVFGEEFTQGRPVDNQIFPIGEPNTAYAKYFIGNSYLAPLLGQPLSMSNVTFEPRCRNNWHIHHRGGQILVCVGGTGWYQEWGKAPQLLHPGDVVNIPAEVKHWHGATADSWFQHIAIAVPAEGASNEWLEPVDDATYDALQDSSTTK